MASDEKTGIKKLALSAITGGGIAVAVLLLLCLPAAALTLGGLIPEGAIGGAAAAMALIASFFGAMRAVRIAGERALAVGASSGAVTLLLLALVRTLCYDGELTGAAAICVCAAVGALAAGLMGVPKKKRRK